MFIAKKPNRRRGELHSPPNNNSKTVCYEGEVPFDDSLRKAVRKQKAVMDVYPKAESSKAFNRLADQLLKWPVTAAPSGHLEFFVEQLVEGSNGR